MNVCARRVFLVASLCFFALLPGLSFAQNTIHVPADVPDIQTAIFAAQNGDTVLVAPGFYFGSITFQGRNITVMSSDGAAVTTVDSGSQPSAQFFNNENNGAVLKGFTFVNGTGIQVSFASPTIEDNVITNNQGCQAGGISLVNSSAIIQRNTISNNRQFCAGTPAAGGISVDGQGSVQILNNTISGNQTAPGVQAGGIFTDAFGTTTISGNKIQNNVTDAAGGGIYANGSNVIIADNLITGNSASTGGGIQIVPGSNAIVVNNTVALNLAQQGSQLQMDGVAGQVNLFNNIFYDLTGSGAIFCSATGVTAFPVALNNDAISSAGGHSGPGAMNAYTGSCADQTGSNGNVQVDPQFVDSINSDFHLSTASPLVDTGDNFALDLPAQDLDGNPRIAAGSAACLPFVDIGAYELVFNSVGSASLATASLNFGFANIGIQSFSTLPVTLTGTGGCAQIASISTGSDYQQTNNCSVLRQGDSCTIQVTFTPTIAGIRTGALKVNMLSPAATLTSELSGVGLNSASVTPAELKFGIQAIQTTQFQSVEIFSLQGQPIQVSSVSSTGDFQQFNNCSQFSSNVCFISVQFTPTVAGPRTGTLTVVSNLGTFAVPLSGDGAAPAPNLSPTSLAFPSQTAGTASSTLPVTLTNNGTTDLVWSSVFSTPDFQVTTPPSCNGFLQAGTSCTFNVAFTPTTLGPITGSMEIDTNGGPVTASLTGIGTALIVSLSPQVLNFANQPLNTSSPSQAITVTNISGIPLPLMSLTAPDNFLATSTCPAVLEVNASCEIDVLFDPVSSGPYGGFVTLGTVAGQVTAALTVGSNHLFHVPSEVPSIFQAVQLAQDGDTILVAPGTYFEQIGFQGKAITIASTAGAAVTTLDGQGFLIPVMSFQNEGPASVLKGFTITHSSNSGIQLFGSSPTIQDNTITENNGCNGAGIQLQGSSAIIKGNTISNNTLTNCGDGAGIWIGPGSNVQVINNLITGNQNSSFGSGGGIAVSGATANIISNTIQGNSSNFQSGGGIALVNGGSANIIQNLITGNSAATFGGGVFAAVGTFPATQLINNTIADNFSPSGSGLFVSGSDNNTVFVNNIITDSSGSSAVSCSLPFLSGLFAFNDVFNSAGGTAYGNCQDLTSISNNISQDPRFVSSASGDYSLQASSPTIDAGTNFPGNTFPPQLPDRDLDGNGRILPGNPATCNGTIDLGAYEFASGANGTPGPLPASWDLGSWQVGSPQQVGTGPQFVFNQSAQGCVAIASIKTTGDFQQTNSCNNAVSSFRSCSIAVSFNPQHLGPRTGSLIVDYGTSAPAVTVALTGQGIDNPPLASPPSLIFDVQSVGTSSAAQQVSIFANSLGNLSVNAIWITGDFSQTNSCGATTVPLGGSCVINVVFTPTASGTGQGSLTVSTNQGTVVVPLTGTVETGAVANFNQSSLTFGSQQVGTSSTALNVTLSNTGRAALSFGIGIGPDFTETSNCPQPLPAGSSCIINIVFNPTVPGPINESLTLSGNSNPPATAVTLTGTGVGPLPSFAPTSLTFATQLAGTTSAAQSVSFSNIGNVPLAITGFAMNGDFSETNNCGTSLAAGASCTINVVFTPTADGTQHGSITLVSNFNGLPFVSLTGTGQAAQASVSPASLTFPPLLLGTTSAAQSVTLTNSGDLPISISGTTISVDYAQTNDCGTSLGVGASCTFSITFTPTVQGSDNGSLVVNGNFRSPVVVALNGIGLGTGPSATLSPAFLIFAHQAVGTTSAPQALTYTNTGDVSLSITTLAIAFGPFAQINTCAPTLAPGASCTINVTFTPPDTTGQSGVLNVFGTVGASAMLSGYSTPQLESPTSLDFGRQIVNAVSPIQTVTFANTTSSPISISGISWPLPFNVVNHCPGTIAVGASCSFDVTLAPTVHGSSSGFFEITGNFAGSPAVVPIVGTATGAAGALSPASLVFAGQPLNTSSASQHVTLTNKGDVTLSISSIQTTGDFSQTNNCPATLISDASCTVNITFTPSAVGVSTGSLSVTSNAAVPIAPVALSGTGAAPGIGVFSPQSLNFGSIAVKAQSAPQTVRLSNTGTGTLTFGIAITGDFSQTNNCGASLLPGANCSINVVFTPTATGNRTGSLSLSGNSSPAPAPIALAGSGIAPLATYSATSLTFAPQLIGTASLAQSLTLSNTGTATLSISSLTISSIGVSDFSQTNNCGASLAVGASCSINVIFAPSARGARSAALSLASNSLPVAPAVSLSGTGQAIQLNPTTGLITFPGQLLNTTSAPQPIPFTNNGDLPVAITGVSTSGDFAQTNDCPPSLAVGAGCTVTATFTPTARGTRTGSLSIAGNFTGSAPFLSLKGTGQALQGTVSPTAMNFQTQVSTTSAPQTVTLTNSGDLSLSISSIATTAGFAQTNTCGSSLAAGLSCTVSVTFTPTVTGVQVGSLTFNTNSTTPVGPVSLSGSGTVVAPSFSPTLLVFGAQTIGTTSGSQSVTLNNSNTVPLSLTAIGAGGDFSQTNNCGSSLPAGGSCTVNVSFTPTGRGTRTTFITATGSFPGIPSVTLSGIGQAVLATVSPASLSFAATPVNSTSAAQTVTFTNAGDLPVAITGTVILGDFAQTNNCGTSLVVGASCTINVTFTPTARGSRTGTVTLQGNFTSPAPVITLAGTGQAFVASLSPASFNFGNEPVNTTTNPQIFTYTNTGDLPLTISGIAVTPDFSQTNTCPATLAVGTSCTINATFVPRAVGVQTTSLTVSADVNSSASLAGNGVMPTASLSPASLTFGHQRVGTASAPQLVTVTNTGAFAFFINQVSFPGGYQITNNCSGLVNPGASCTVSVVFAPTNTQSGVGSFTIGGDFTATPPSVSLSGTADASTGTLSPIALTFANQVVGSTSASQTVMLSSTGDVPINLSGIQTTGDFSQTNNCGTSVAAGTNCIITVTFTPTAHGTRSGSLSVSGDFTGAAPSATLSGNGTTPTAAWSPASLTFSNQLVGTSSSAQPVTLTNSGDGPLTISGITTTGDFGQTNTCGGTLAPNSSCIINITFTPAATGSRSGSLSLGSNSSIAVSPVTLAGTGIAPLAVLSPASLSFTNQAVNTTSAIQTATLTNSGTAALAISNINMTGNFAQTNNCGTSLPAGANCTISVTFTPTGTGSRLGSLNVTDNSLGGSTQTASLSGTGIDFSLSASPSSASISAGKIASFTVSVSGSSFNSSVSLSCSGLPIDSSCSFSPATVTPGSTSVNSTLQLSTTPRHKTGTPAGTYNVTITGTSGSVQHSSTIVLIVN
ncbi:MAG TPA: choice-of-anchor D domain-containing protein [Candidatus Angelobacter sp.]|jgi:hypothetical protein